MTFFTLQAGGPPQFFLIEPYLKEGVLVHFDTEANRRYELQFCTNVTSAHPPVWKPIYSVEDFPFDGHYIVFHSFTNGAVGFFRLVATP
ncbi:MAG TPA: hypothetical protein VMF06_21720 [Candidatus Limnocylindria bacterium]|nr:hypothetical protein [Candidatus Limnocylindria bacterium]